MPEDHSEQANDLSAVISAVLTGTRVLVGIAARSLGAVADRVTLPQFRMLVVLARYDETKLVTLAEVLNVNSSTALRMAERLATAELIVREVNPLNRRESLIRLTGKGRRIVDEVTARRRKEIGMIVSRLSPEQCRTLVEAMNAFNEAGGGNQGNGLHPFGWPDDRAS